MSREKQIEEMAFDLCLIDRCKHLPQEECHNTTCAHCEAEALYNAGYRKQSEVIDEFAKRLKERNKIYCINENDLKEMNFVIDQIARELKGGA